jgi:hypothetical protein
MYGRGATMNRLMSLLVLFVIFLCVSRAKAGCVAYFDGGTAFCSAEGGCEGSYPIIVCGLGTIQGICTNGPNGGLCCGTSFDVAQIYPGEDTCGPIGIFGRQHYRNKKTFARLKKTKAAISNYSQARVLFIPNRCEHAYEILVENYAPSSRGN